MTATDPAPCRACLCAPPAPFADLCPTCERDVAAAHEAWWREVMAGRAKLIGAGLLGVDVPNVDPFV